jgi:valyl-tRNA synthetase
MSALIKMATDGMTGYNYAVMKDIRNFIWHTFADYYIEMTKYRLGSDDNALRNGAIKTLVDVLSDCLRLMAPFTPFITEEIFHSIGKASIHHQRWPISGRYNMEIAKKGRIMCDIISGLRRFKMDSKIGMGKPLASVTVYGDLTLLGRIKDEIAGTIRIGELLVKTGKGMFDIGNGVSFDANI